MAFQKSRSMKKSIYKQKEDRNLTSMKRENVKLIALKDLSCSLETINKTAPFIHGTSITKTKEILKTGFLVPRGCRHSQWSGKLESKCDRIYFTDSFEIRSAITSALNAVKNDIYGGKKEVSPIELIGEYECYFILPELSAKYFDKADIDEDCLEHDPEYNCQNACDSLRIRSSFSIRGSIPVKDLLVIYGRDDLFKYLAETIKRGWKQSREDYWREYGEY